MSMIDLLKDQIGGAVMGKIGESMGVDSGKASAGLDAMLPTLLGGIIGKSETPEGARELSETLDGNDFDGSLFEKLPGMLSGGNATALTGLGGGLVARIFGDKIAVLLPIISKITGIGGDKSKGLMAVLMPLVMSFLGKQKREQNLDATGLASMLAAEKASVEAAMPSEIQQALTSTAPPAATADPVMSKAGSTTTQSSDSGGGLFKILLPLAILAGLGLLAFKFLSGDKEIPVLDEDVTVNAPELPGAPDVSAAKEKLSGVLDEYTETFTSITDEASAEEAVPKIEDLNGRLDGVVGMMDKMPETVRTTVAGQLGPMLQPVTELVEKAMAIPGVGPILEPVVNTMKEKLAALGG